MTNLWLNSQCLCLNDCVFLCVIFFVFYINTIFYSVFTIASYAYTVTLSRKRGFKYYLKEDASYCDSQHGDTQPEEIPQSPQILTLKHGVFKKVIYININDSNRVILSKHRFDGVFDRRNYCFIMLIARLFSGTKKVIVLYFAYQLNIVFYHKFIEKTFMENKLGNLSA